MATFLGREGSVKFDRDGSGSGTPLAIAEVRSFRLTTMISSYDANTMEPATGNAQTDAVRGWDHSVGGRRSWNVEVECFYDPGDNAAGGQSNINVGDQAALELFTQSDTTGNEEFGGTARVEEFSVNSSEDGLIEYSLKLKGVGALTRTTIA